MDIPKIAARHVAGDETVILKGYILNSFPKPEVPVARELLDDAVTRFNIASKGALAVGFAYQYNTPSLMINIVQDPTHPEWSETSQIFASGDDVLPYWPGSCTTVSTTVAAEDRYRLACVAKGQYSAYTRTFPLLPHRVIDTNRCPIMPPNELAPIF